MDLQPFLVVAGIGAGSYLILYREKIARRMAAKNPGNAGTFGLFLLLGLLIELGLLGEE